MFMMIPFYIISNVSKADHLFLDTIYNPLSNLELQIIFSGKGLEKVKTSYVIYKRGDTDYNSVLSYWGRVIDSIDNNDELKQALSTINDINDVCFIRENMNSKTSAFSEFCY